MLLARQEHEDKRKRSKIEWKAAREGYHEAVLDLKNTEAKYRHYQGTIIFLRVESVAHKGLVAIISCRKWFNYNIYYNNRLNIAYIFIAF